MRRFAPVGVLLVLVVGGCGVETVESSYNARLINEIGAGSAALAGGFHR